MLTRVRAEVVAKTSGKTGAVVELLAARRGLSGGEALARDEDSKNRHALSFCLSMIFSENRFPLFRIML
jgi:hypothetical protein